MDKDPWKIKEQSLVQTLNEVLWAGVRCCGPVISLRLLPLMFPWQSHNRSQENHIWHVERVTYWDKLLKDFWEMKVIKITYYSAESISRLHFLNHPDNFSRAGAAVGWMWTVTNKCISMSRGQPCTVALVNHLLIIYGHTVSLCDLMATLTACPEVNSHWNSKTEGTQDN